MDHKKETAAIYTILHFLVDFTTIFLISGVLTGPLVGMVNRGWVVIVYNLVAFAGQLPMGMISDVIGRNRMVAALGCALAGIAYPMAFVSPWSACVLAALGNGAFHIGAGSEILEMSMPKAGPAGLFVSSGALGVWLAYRADGDAVLWLCPAAAIIASLFLLLARKKGGLKAGERKVRYGKPNLWVLTAVICFSLTVVIRSLLGTVMDFSWKKIPALSFLFVAALASGKAVGGYLGDRFGYIRTAAVSMAVSLVSFFFAFDYWQAGILAVFCFNMTMPLTLAAIAGVSGKKYGFAFGITTFALAMGFIPVVFGANEWFGLPLLMGGALASVCLLEAGYFILKKYNGAGVEKQ